MCSCFPSPKGTKSDLNCPSMRFELLDLGELHDGASDISQPLGREVRARDVLDEGPEIDTRVLLGIPIGGFVCKH